MSLPSQCPVVPLQSVSLFSDDFIHLGDHFVKSQSFNSSFVSPLPNLSIRESMQVLDSIELGDSDKPRFFYTSRTEAWGNQSSPSTACALTRGILVSRESG